MEELHADKALRHFEVQLDHGTNPKEPESYLEEKR